MKRFCALFAVFLMMTSLPLKAAAAAPYRAYLYDGEGEAVPTLAGYEPSRAVSGRDLGVSDFTSPGDFCEAGGHFYIADTGGNRIVKTDSELTKTEQILDHFTLPDGSSTTLQSPTGVYVSAYTGYLYIADSENSRALVADENGEVKLVLTKPDSPLFDSEGTFVPDKILSDSAGNIYIILSGAAATKGAVCFDQKGTFLGYFGANSVEKTPAAVLSRFVGAISSQSARAKRRRLTPTAFDNFDLDREGMFIYTSTSSPNERTDAIKKVNPEGHNLLRGSTVWGDLNTAWYGGNTYRNQIVDVDIGADGSVNCLDAQNGRIFQYDDEENLRFIFGARGTRLGAFSVNVSALETRGEHCEEVYVLDADYGTITLFEQTEFGALVHKAGATARTGDYKDALAAWEAVLRRDANCRAANLGAANACYSLGEYSRAMDYAKRAGDAETYDKAFARARAAFLRAHFPALFGAVCALCAAGLGLYLYHRHRKRRAAS